MIEVNKTVSACVAFMVACFPASAEQTYYMGVHVPPFLQANSTYYQKGIEALQMICDETEDETLISLCTEGVNIADYILDEYLCIDPEYLPYSLNDCQVQGIETYTASLQYILNIS